MTKIEIDADALIPFVVRRLSNPKYKPGNLTSYVRIVAAMLEHENRVEIKRVGLIVDMDGVGTPPNWIEEHFNELVRVGVEFR